MKRCGNYNLWKGRKVKIYSVSDRNLGVWEYDHAEYVAHFGRKRLFTPVFKQGKKIIHGYICWWIPLADAKKIEENFKK